MPRYFFNLHDGTLELDPEGVELDGPASARMEAYRLLVETAAEQDRNHDDVHLTASVHDEAGMDVVLGRLDIVLAATGGETV